MCGGRGMGVCVGGWGRVKITTVKRYTQHSTHSTHSLDCDTRGNKHNNG